MHDTDPDRAERRFSSIRASDASPKLGRMRSAAWLPTLAIVLALLAPLTASAQAVPEARRKMIEASLAMLDREQQSIFQQFQMTQELRRFELQSSTLNVPQIFGPGVPPPNFEDVVSARAARDERLRRYGEELDRLYARYREIDEQKRALLAELTAPPQQ